ncbi:MAG TPA: hypothetical protein VF316_11425 [Polyangiaceae bacterium]
MGTGRASVDIERVRVPAEREVYPGLERDERGAHTMHVAQDGATTRRELLSTALLLTDTMAPEAYAAARDAMAALGVEDTIELFQSDSRGMDTARLALCGNPVGVEFMGGYLGCLDRGGLLAVLGHEIGHCLAHSGTPKFAWALSASQTANTPNKRAYSMAAEFTADRFGLLACRDLAAALRLEMRSAAGRSAASLRFDTESYLKQCRFVAEDIIARGGMAQGWTHPEHCVRGYAEWLFSEADLYASITGVGPGSRSIEEVNAVLQALLGIGPKPVPAPKPSTQAAPAAVVGEREDEAVARSAMPTQTLEELATDILTDGARRKLAATGRALATMARSVAPSLKRFAEQLEGETADPKASPEPEDTADPLEDDRRELIARIEELERRGKEK